MHFDESLVDQQNIIFVGFRGQNILELTNVFTFAPFHFVWDYDNVGCFRALHHFIPKNKARFRFGNSESVHLFL